MLKDKPYSVLKDKIDAYEVMLLCDIDGQTFTDIAKRLGLTASQISLMYNKTMVKQRNLYINHLSIALGYNDRIQVEKIYTQTYECYQSRTYACAYLEKEYRDILTEYRAGEPGMPEKFVENMPPLRGELTEEEVMRIVKMREEQRTSYIDIGIELDITKEKAKHTYDRYYHTKALELADILGKSANSNLEKKEIIYCFLKNCYSAKKRYEILKEKFDDKFGK